MSKAHSSKREQKSPKQSRKKMQSLSQSRKMYQQKMAAKKAAQQQNNKKPVRTPKCSYCKEEGHWRVDRSTGHVACPKLVRKSNRAANKNSQRRAKKVSWQMQRVEEVEKETGVKGWDVSGGKDNTQMAVEKIKPVLKFSVNPFAAVDDSDEDDEVEQQKKAARKAAAAAREAAAAVAPEPREKTVLAGAWIAGAPVHAEVPAMVELVREPVATCMTSDSSEEETQSKSELLVETGPEVWGDESDEE